MDTIRTSLFVELTVLLAPRRHKASLLLPTDLKPDDFPDGPAVFKEILAHALA
jgi:hypothetical protein